MEKYSYVIMINEKESYWKTCFTLHTVQEISQYEWIFGHNVGLEVLG